MPIFSIIVPVYNVEKYIYEAINSVFNQSISDIEVIVVDDGSTDKTASIISSSFGDNPRLKLIKQPNSGKPSIARNVGIANATGNYICFLDGDDKYLTDRLAKHLDSFLADSKISIVFSDVLRISNSGEKLPETWLKSNNFARDAKDILLQSKLDNTFFCSNKFYNFASSRFCPIHTSAISIKREILHDESVWFPENMLTGEDIDLWFRLIKNYNAAFINSPLSAYRIRNESVTYDKEAFYLGTINAHLINFERAEASLSDAEKDYYLTRIARRCQHLGYYYQQKGKVGDARKYYIESYKLKKDPSALVKYFKTLIPKYFKSLLRTT